MSGSNDEFDIFFDRDEITDEERELIKQMKMRNR